MAESFDNLYKKNENLFGIVPSEVVSVIPRILKGRKVLDMGAGQGRNSLFLANNGFDVTAVDASGVALESLRVSAQKLELPINTHVSKIEEYDFCDNFDAFTLNYVLHFLKRDFVIDFIKKIQDHTIDGGLNVITTFTQNGDFYRREPTTTFFYPAKGEIEKMYSGWNIIKCYTTITPALERGENGEILYNETINFIAQK